MAAARTLAGAVAVDTLLGQLQFRTGSPEARSRFLVGAVVRSRTVERSWVKGRALVADCTCAAVDRRQVQVALARTLAWVQRGSRVRCQPEARQRRRQIQVVVEHPVAPDLVVADPVVACFRGEG